MKRKSAKGLIWISALTGLLCGVTAGAFLGLTKDLPQIIALESYKPPAITRVYSADRVLIAELYAEKRDPVPLSQIPEALKTALITTEDRRFYEHSGIAVKGILRAIVENVRRGRFAQGASTLTQQLAKTLFLTPRKTLLRKLREAILALQLERRYTKDEILTLYLNQIYLGSGTYGVASAARVYFNKELKELTLAQCALIAGLPKAPSRYSPLVNPELAIKRRNIVLKQMQLTGVISESEYREAVDEPLEPHQIVQDRRSPVYFVNHIKKELEAAVGADRLYKSGLTVYTTLSHAHQEAAEEALTLGLEQLSARMASQHIVDPEPQAALIALDVSTGGILAMVGGHQDSKGNFNRATQAKRQPGSAFKPIVYALAVERGFHQHQILRDAPVVYPSYSREKEWQPENFSKSYAGEVTMRWALAHSKNIPAVRLMEKLGPSSVIQFGQALGLQSNIAPNLSLALGTSEMTLLELTSAYAVFANQGKHTNPYGVASVVDDAGHTIWKAKPKQRIAMSRSGATIVTNMLEAVIQDGTGQKARILPGPIAGKTGTTNDYKDALFVGYCPSIAAGVWVGNDDGATLGPEETGARAALPIWILFMQKALDQKRHQYFDIPDGVRQIHIHPRTGHVLEANHPNAVPVLVKRDGAG
ncbi:MAG: PBP1A family penicillin-binding protein [Desulfobacteraceae bacterium]|jgi:penicillin-binding protein 1A